MENGTNQEHKLQLSMSMERYSDNGEADGSEAVVSYRGWKVMPYVIGNETFEKLGTIGTVANLLVYLTTVYHIKSVTAATLINFFMGTTNLAPLIGAFLSDSFLGRYTTLGVASVASFIGMIILTLTAAITSAHPPPCGNGTGGKPCHGPRPWQLSILLSAFAFLVVGAGGIRPCNLAFGADQFNPHTPSGQRGIASFFNWYYFTFTVAMMLSATLIVYLQSNISWPLGLGVPAVLMGLSCALFFMGTRLYVRVRPEGSPFTSFAQVFVAAFRKRRLDAPTTADQLFDPPHRSNLVSKIAYTDQFCCLDKASIVTPDDELKLDGTPVNPWRLCSMQQVEQVKCLARIIPVWSSGILYYIVLVQLSTFVVLQSLQTDRLIGKSGFQVPAASFVVFQMLAMTVWIPVYDRLVVPAMRRLTKREGGITLFHRIGAGIVLSIVTMVVAALVEQRRRRTSASSPMSCFWLVPQQLLAGMSEAFAVIGQVEFFYRQFPENMRSVAGALLFLGMALANYASGLMVTAVNRTTGQPGWLAQDLNHGRVDLFYLVVGALSVVNLAYFVACARWYRFKKSVDGGRAVELMA